MARSASEPVNLYLKWYHKAQFAGIYMAEQNGYFLDEGLNVKVVGYNPDMPPVAALEAGIAEYSVQDPEIFSRVDSGLDFVSIATYGQQSPWILATDSTIPTLQDLSGNTVLLSFGHATDLMIGLIDSNGLTDIAIQPYQTPAEFHYLLKSNAIHAVMGYRTNEAYFFEQQHPDVNFFDPTIVGYETVGNTEQPVRLYSDMLVATRIEALEHPARAAAMIRAVNKGWEYVIKNPVKSLEVILDAYPIESAGFSRQQTQFELDYMIKAVALPSVPIGSQSVARWEKIINYYQKIGLMSNDNIDVSQYIWDGSLLESMILEKSKTIKDVLYTTLLVTLIVAAILLYYSHTFIQRFLHQWALTKDIKRGMADREFFFHFQPVVHPSGQLVGAEALVRWNHPKRGLLYPDAFIETIESDLQLVQIFDMYVIENVMKTLSEMPLVVREGLFFSINVSVHFFSIPNFDARIIALGKHYSIPLQQLDIELTERLSTADFIDLATAVKRLKDIGLSVTLDDYGTGYTSLNLLNLVPFDKLKIDKSLIDRIEHSERARGTLKSIYMLAGVHDMDIVCEGVETSEQVMVILNEIGGYSVTMQGYYYCKPQVWHVLQYGEYPLANPPVRRVGINIINPAETAITKLEIFQQAVEKSG